ncbi:MAG: hypothetical protein R3F56_09790 [Planctomycetota bacterium]
MHPTPPSRGARRRGDVALALALCAGACQGDGSDVGPSLGAKPPVPLQVQVFNDGGEPVCGARVVSPLGSAVSGRAGRAELGQRPSGDNPYRVEAGAASAHDGDLLQDLAFRAGSIDDARALERAVHLADVGTSDSLTVPAGVQTSGWVLDDVANGGGLLVINAGANVSDGIAPAVTLRTGKLEPRHLPCAVPTPPGFAALLSRAVQVSPPTVMLGPGVVLAVPDELGAAGTTSAIDLFRLDEASGGFVRVNSGVVSPGRIATPLSGIDRGGLYVFATFTPRVATASGRVVDATGKPVARAFVQAGGLATTTADDGTFALAPLAAVDAAGNPRTEIVDLIGGRGFLPQTAPIYAAMRDGNVALGDVTLDTLASGHLRVLVVERGALLPDRRVRTSESLGEMAAASYAGADGVTVLEDVSVGFYGFTFGRPFDRLDSFRTQGLIRMPVSEPVVDARIFSQRGPYDERRRGNSVQVFDADFGGPVQDVVVVRGSEPEKGFLGRTFEGGVLFTGLGADDQVTAVNDRKRSERRVISAFTAVATASHRIELPVHSNPRPQVGAFDRHGLVDARIHGATNGLARELRVGHPLAYRDWFERVMLDQTGPGARVPVKLAPTQSAEVVFTVGVPRPRGHLALVETRPEANGDVVQGAYVAFDLTVAEGQRLALEGDLLRLDTEFTASPGGGRDPRIGVWLADWGVRHTSGTIADVARGTIPVTVRLMGGTLTFDLPALGAVPGMAQHVVCVHGRAAVGGAQIEQRQVITVERTSANVAGAMLSVPELLEPVAGQTVSADGFTVAFTPPSDATFVVVSLRNDGAGELREWTAVLPRHVTSFAFRRLPTEAAAVLAPGLDWQLEVTAFRVNFGPVVLEPDLYATVLANYVTLGPADLGVDAISKISIPLRTM